MNSSDGSRQPGEQKETTGNPPDTCTSPLELEANASLAELESSIATLSAHIQAATYRLLCLVGAFDRRDGWSSGGFVSCAHWLAWRTGEDLVTAREKVRVARCLEQLPRISAAFARAELSYSKVRAMTRIACPENEEALLVIGKEGTASQLERVVRGAGRAQAIDVADVRQRHEGRYLQYYHDEQGMLELRCRLNPEAGALVAKALEAASSALRERARKKPEGDGSEDNDAAETEPECRAEDVSHTQRLADALVLVAESALDHDLARGCRAERYQVVVHVDADTLSTPSAISAKACGPGRQATQVATAETSAEACEPGRQEAQVATGETSEEACGPGRQEAKVATAETSAEAWHRAELEDGVGLSAETCRRLACEGSVVMLVEDHEGNPIHLGRKKRRLSAALARALKSRDGGCQFPGCTHRRYVEAHHLTHWADGGKTELANLVELCSFHHHAVHEQGFRVSRAKSGALRFCRPDGTRIPSAPRPMALAGDSPARLRQQHRTMKLGISERSGAPTEWTGLPLDLDWAVQCVMPAKAG